MIELLESDSQLNRKISSLENIVDSLTLPHSEESELDALARPVPRMHVFPSGHSSDFRAAHESPLSRQGQESTLSSFKEPNQSVSSCVRRKAKFQRSKNERVREGWR